MSKKAITPIISILLLIMLTVAEFFLFEKEKPRKKKIALLTSRKGITPIISILLLIMLTVAISSGFYFWYSKMQSSSQQNVQQYSEEILADVITEVEIVDDPEYNTLAEDNQCTPSALVFHLQNVGARELEIDTSTAFLHLWDSDGNTICSTDLEGNCLAYEYRLYAAVYNDTGNSSIYYTTDGSSWPEMDSTIHRKLYDLALDDDKLYCVGNDTTVSSLIYKSCNHQELISDGAKENASVVYAIKYFDGEFYIGDNGGNISYRNSSNWDTVHQTAEDSVQALEVFDSYLYAGSFGVGKIFRTSDGTSWSEVNATVGNVTAFLVNNTFLYAGTANGSVLRSSDGGNWTTVNTTGDDAVLSFVVLNDVMFAGTNNSAGGSVYNSTDGVNWDSAGTFGEDTVYDLEIFGNQIYAAVSNVSGTGGGFIYRSLNGSAWEQVADLVNGTYALQNHTKCTNYEVNCTQGCSSGMVPGETRLMELKLSDTDCSISDYGKNSKFSLKVTFGSESQVSGRFTKRLIDISSSVTPCGNTYPMCNGFCDDFDPFTAGYCTTSGTDCMCMPVPPCGAIPAGMDCSIGTGKIGCELGTCSDSSIEGLNCECVM